MVAALKRWLEQRIATLKPTHVAPSSEPSHGQKGNKGTGGDDPAASVSPKCDTKPARHAARESRSLSPSGQSKGRSPRRRRKKASHRRNKSKSPVRGSSPKQGRSRTSPAKKSPVRAAAGVGAAAAAGAAQPHEDRPLSRRQEVRRAREAYRTGAYKKMLYPDTYVVDNPIVYQGNPRKRDTTNRTLVERGREAGFDPLGFRNDVAMQRNIFYYCPYLSCLNCNTVIFIDASRLRSNLNEGIIPHKAPLEALPACSSCGRTDTYLVGADDLAALIQKNKAAMVLKIRRERAASRVIQQAYRRSLYYRHGRAMRDAAAMYTKLQHRLSAIIQSMYRMRLAKRRLAVERDLKDIKKAHPIVFKWSLTTANQDARIKVFWYNQPVMVRQLYDNYWILLERTGFRPKRHIVEDNIHEIARRVRWRTAWYATRIQKMWRGILTRRYMGVYRRECAWIREQEVTAVFKSQRAFRGWLGRREGWRLAQERKKEAIRKAFVLEQDRQRDEKMVRRGQVELLREYTKERKYEVTCRRLNRTDLKAHKGRKMIAYADSMYGGDEVTQGMVECLDALRYKKEKDKVREAARLERLNYVKKRQADNKYLQKYYDNEIRAGRRHLIETLSSQKGYKKEFIQQVIGESNAKKAKYAYPEGLNIDKRRILRLDPEEMYDDDMY